MGYVGSEEFIRLQFEEYLLSLISAVKCHNYLQLHSSNIKVMLPQVDGDPAIDFGADWIEAWTRSENYKIWDQYTDSHLFDIVDPKHPCAGGLTIDDVQRRIAEQVKEFHLDERFAVGKEVLGRNLQAGKEKASTVFNKLYADMEVFRETQRKKHEEARREAHRNGQPSPNFIPSDLNGAKQTVQSVGSKAGAYIGSWGTWMGEKRKTGWGRNSSGSQTTTPKQKPPAAKENVSPLRLSSQRSPVSLVEGKRKGSYEESLFDADIKRGEFTTTTTTTATPALGTSKPVDPIHDKVSVPHVDHPSKFHEEIDDEPVVVAVPEQAVREIEAVDSVKWAEEAASSVGNEKVGEEHERSSKVIEALEAASGTPISP